MREMQRCDEIKYTYFEAPKVHKWPDMSCWFFHHHLSMLKHKPFSVSKTPLALSPKSDSEVNCFLLPSTLTAVRTSAPFYIPSVRRQNWISPGCRTGSSEDSSTQFAAKPLPCQLLYKPLPQPLTWKGILQFQLCLHAIFLASLQLITNATSTLVMWTPG